MNKDLQMQVDINDAFSDISADLFDHEFDYYEIDGTLWNISKKDFNSSS